MATDLLMPKLGLTMTEGVLLEWNVAPGEAVSRGQVIYVVETDKIANEVEAETDGILEAQLVPTGATVPVGAVVGRLGNGDAAEPSLKREEAQKTVAEVPVASPAKMESAAPPPAPTSSRIIATPLARRMARQQAIDLSVIAGTGPGGRIKAVDVDRTMQSGAKPAAPVATAETSSRAKPTAAQSGMARRLAKVKHGIPHFYLSTEIEVSALIALRETLNADPDAPRLTLNHFLIAATGRALHDRPGLNRVWADDEIVSFTETDVAMAVETERGLFVPVLRNAGGRPLDQVAADARRLVERARAGRLTLDAMTGGAIAVSNAGMHDVTWVTSIINPGQSAILGIGSVRELFRPGPDGAPLLRREMGVVLSADHRVHTGVEGLAFLACLKAWLENPTRLLRHL